jgi:hypothetical protein
VVQRARTRRGLAGVRKIRAVIEAIPEHAWRPIPYWLSTAEVSGADVTETSYTAFAGTKDATEARLIVRRVRPTPGSQLALFAEWDYHALLTDRPGDTLELEADHRRHAVIEQSIAELKSAGWAHAPSGRYDPAPTPPGLPAGVAAMRAGGSSWPDASPSSPQQSIPNPSSWAAQRGISKSCLVAGRRGFGGREAIVAATPNLVP